MKLKPIKNISIQGVKFKPNEDFFLMGVRDDYMMLRNPVKNTNSFRIYNIPFDNFLFFEHVED